MVTRKDLIIRGSEPQQQGRSELARRTPQGLSEVSFEFDPEQLQRSFPPLSEVNQPRPTSVTTIIINGDYYAGGEAAGPDKKSWKRQRQLQLDNEQRDREDRRERAERQHSIFTLLGFFGYLVILVVLCLIGTGLAMLGAIHH